MTSFQGGDGGGLNIKGSGKAYTCEEFCVQKLMFILKMDMASENYEN